MQYDYHKDTDSKSMVYIRDHFSEIVMVFSLIAFLLTGIYALFSFKTENTQLTVDRISYFNSGWRISEVENADSTHTLRFRNTVPKDIENNSTLAFKSTDEVVYVKVGGELIYTYGEENNFRKPINLGSHYILIQLPEGAQGKEIDISATYHGKQTNWRRDRDFMIEGNDGIILMLIKNDLPSVVICFIMTFLSLFELFKAIYLASRHQPFRTTIYLGLFILASSNWLASETILMQLMFKNMYFKYIITYFSFLTLPCLFPMFAKEKMTRYNLPLAFASVVSWAYACVSMLIFVNFSIGFEKHLYVIHGLMAFVVAIVLVCCILDRKNKQLRNLLAGTVILAFFAIISMISYHNGYINSVFSAYHFRDFFFAGMISFIIILLYDSYQQSAKDKHDAALSNFYKQSAYTDLLTQLGSRTAFTEDFKHAEKDIEKYNNVNVIMLDLNNLKQINDIKGHAVGDELIKSLAECLYKTFDGKGKVYRIGGDEFVVLITDLPDDKIDGYLEKLYENINSQENNELSESTVAIGFAQRNSKENTDLKISELLKIADERMYEDKKRKKGDVKGVAVR